MKRAITRACRSVSAKYVTGQISTPPTRTVLGCLMSGGCMVWLGIELLDVAAQAAQSEGVRDAA